ncbi:MAG: hypothetical protein U5L75_03175 [Candidatus Campbellbacteria bacterium]|nr:hypothetical protein [Candidatus Campbellbacteria bacterium]
MMKRPAFKKIFTYGLFPFLVLFLAFGPVGAEVAHGCNLVRDFKDCSGTMVSTLLSAINGILSLLLYLIGAVLDKAIDFSITTNLYQSDSVNIAWTLLRDIINISFIFILLYVAIGTILRIESINWKKHLTAIIIAALLVNFSLFLTKVVVDAGNILASSFYTTITECGDGNECKDVEGNSRDEVGISERFMNALGIQKINDFRLEQVENGWQGVRINLLKTVIILMSMWIFLSAAILFVARTFALIFIFVLSPIGVAGANLPILSKYAQQWREELFKWTILGAVFLFLVFVVLTFAYQAREENAIDTSDVEVSGEVREFVPVVGDTSNGETPESLSS